MISALGTRWGVSSSSLNRLRRRICLTSRLRSISSWRSTSSFGASVLALICAPSGAIATYRYTGIGCLLTPTQST
jgi:hypothetical protein